MDKRLLLMTTLATVAGGLSAIYHQLFRRPRPTVGGTLQVSGLEKSVEVLRDRWGIPHIFARTDHDLFFAQGFVHAQDRLWQMEYWRRTAAGRLAEVLGPEALPIDRWARVLRLYQSAEEAWPHHDDEARSAAIAYAEGVNACLEVMGGRWPPEFRLLRFEPQRWTPVDSIAVIRVMVLIFSTDFQAELVRERLMEMLGEERFWEVWPAYPPYNPLIAQPGLEMLGNPFAAGSNAWAVGGGRSTTGAPLLANDPHVLLTSPPPWYQVHLHGPSYQVIGASLAGVPGVIIGHNARVAWGVTNSLADCQDLYVETRHPEHSHLFRRGEEWVPARVYEERIFVRGTARPEPLRVTVTHHGPLISDLLPDESRDLALRWSLYEPDNAIGAVLQLNRVSNWEEFRAAATSFSAPPLNFCYADVDGHIGWSLGGRIPLRDFKSITPVDGASGDFEWQGYLAPEQLPCVLDPPAGYVVHANNKPVGEDFPFWLGLDFFPGFRARRIAEAIEERLQHDLDTFAAIQSDTRSIPEHMLARHLAALPEVRLDLGQLRTQLGQWDGNMVADSVEATVAFFTLLRLRHRLVSDKLAQWTAAFEGTPPVLAEFFAMTPLACQSVAWVLDQLNDPESPWWQPAGQADGAARDAVLREVFEQTADWLLEWGKGSIPAWGSVNRLRLAHLFGRHPALRLLFEPGTAPFDGGPFTVSASFRDIMPDNAEGLVVAPSWRFLADLSDWDRCRASLPGGQCGVPGSRHFADGLEDWLAGRYHPLLWTREAVEEATVARLILTPR